MTESCNSTNLHSGNITQIINRAVELAISQKMEQIENGNFKKYLNESELAHRWQVSVKTLRKWRLEGGGPRYNKFGSAVRYSQDDIRSYEAQSTHYHTSEVGQ